MTSSNPIFDDPELAALIGDSTLGLESSPTIANRASAIDGSPQLDDDVRELLAEAEKIVASDKSVDAALTPHQVPNSSIAGVRASEQPLQWDRPNVTPSSAELAPAKAVIRHAVPQTSALSPSSLTVIKSANGRSNAFDVNAFSLEEENTILNDILKSLGDGGEDDYGASALVAESGGIGLGELGSDGSIVMTQEDLDLEAALEQAERMVSNSNAANVRNSAGVPVLKIQIIQTIKSEIEKSRTTAGAPCSVDNCLKWADFRGGRSRANRPVIAIGTTLGMILLFNTSNKLCGVCGSGASSGSIVSDSTPKGATTAISFSRNGSSIVAGYENGNVTLWDTDTLQPTKTFDGEFSSPVVKISFCHPDSSRFVSLDASGIIKVFHVSSVMGKYVGRTNTIHTGFERPCADICVITDKIDIINSNGQNDGIRELTYTAAICKKQLSVFVASFGLQTSLSLAFTSPAPKHAQDMYDEAADSELVAWVEDNAQRKLVVSWATLIEVFHVLSDSSGHVTLQRTAQFNSPAAFISASALDGCCVMFVDTCEIIHVFDASHNTIVQSIELAETIGLAPHSSEHHDSSLRLGNAGRISHNGGTVTIQGKSSFVQCFLKTWEERVNDFLNAGQWDELFALAKDLSQDMAMAVVGLSAAPAQRKANIHARIEELLNAYITQMDAQLRPPSDQNDSSEHLVLVIDKIIAFCSETQLQELYFTCVMPKLEDLRAGDRGIYALEAALNEGKFCTIPSVYISNFAKLFRSPTRFNAVNRLPSSSIPHGTSAADHALRRMEIALTKVTNDLHLLIKTAEALKLYRLMCCILSFRHHKYVEALQSVLPSSLGNGQISEGSLDVAFEYIDRLFEDKSLVGDEAIIPWYRKSAKESIVAFLVSDAGSLGDLLKCDAIRCINLVTKIIATGIDLPSTLDYGNANNDDRFVRSEDANGPWTGSATVSRSDFALSLYSQLVDSTISPNRPWEQERKKWPAYNAIIHMFINLSLCVAQGYISFGSEAASDDFLMRAAYHFSYAFEKANLDRRTAITNAFVRLVTCKYWNHDLSPAIENEVKSKRLGRVHAALLSAGGDYNDAIACFLARDYNQVDPHLAKGVFPFIGQEMRMLLTQGEDAADAVAALRFSIKNHLGNLIHIDAIQLSQLVFEHLPDDHHEVFQALQGIGDNTFLLYMRGMVSKGDRAFKEDKYAQNVYIGLLCKHEPASVYEYLTKNESDIQYDLGQALHDCQKYSVTDATILLLEKTVQITQAMEALMAAITSDLLRLRSSVISNPSHYTALLFPDADSACPRNVPNTSDVSALPLGNVTRTLLYDNDKPLSTLSAEDEKLAKMVNLGIDLCTRYNQKLSLDDLKVWWFRLLDRFATPKRLLSDRQTHFRDANYHQSRNAVDNVPFNGFDDNEVELLTKTGTFPMISRPLTQEGIMFLSNMQAVYARYISHILTAMVKTLPISTVVSKIVADNERDSFGPFKPIIVGILETLSFDLEANRLCKLCADSDTLLIANELKRTATSAISPSSTECGICGKHLSCIVGDVDSLRLYTCGHGFHEICCGTLTQCYICSNYEEMYGEGSIGALSAHGDVPRPNKEASNVDNSKKMSFEPQNVDYIMRRLRQVRNKLDNSKIYKDMLKSIVKGVSGESLQQSGKKEKHGGGIIVDGVNISNIDTSAFGGGSNLLLAPPELRNTVSVVDIVDESHKAVSVPKKMDEELTDADLIAIFGKSAYDAMVNTAEEESAQLRLAWASDDAPDDEEWESEAMKELMGLK